MTGAPWQMLAAAGAPGPVRALVGNLDAAPLGRCASHGVWFDRRTSLRVLQHAGTEPTGVVAWLRRLFA